MSVNSVQQFLNVRDSHLRVVSGNVHADQMVLGGITVDTSHGLQSVTNTSNVTTNTVEFSNTTTAFVTTANVEVGGELTVSGNATVSSNLTVTANAEIGGDLTVSGNTFYSNNTSIHVDSNVVAEFTGPHGRLPKVVPLKKYPEIAFISNEGVGGTYDRNLSSTTPFEGTFIQAGYTASSSSNYGSSVGQGAWNLFAHRNSEPNDNYSWYSQNATNYNGTVGGNYSYSGNKNIGTGAVDGEWVKIEMPEKIRLKSYILWGADLESEFPQGWTLYGSDNGTSWSSIHSKDGQTIGSGSWSTTSNSATGKFVNLDVTSSDYYKYFALVFTRAGARNDYIGIGEWELYGYEEDPPAGDTSVDTTFTSIMNTPQTTGANVYVDAKLSSDFTNQVTGPTPVGPAATHNDTGKYWELTGALTSNVTLEANTFLEGDQPHAVSVWFNSSNLEANVSNTCVFSVSDQEHLNSQNLDLQSNTWHNLTYAYQGEGGSRVTYLDGRKVAEDQAEDTFGEYPPFAMTGYSQGGYVVSASGEYNTTQYNAWKAFDGDTTTSDNSFITLNDSYVAATGATKGNYLFSNAITDNTGTVHSGEWIKMEFPHKLVINSVKMDKRPYASPNLERMLPAEFAILGSNDDQTWYLIHNRTGIATNAPTGTHFVSTGNYKSKGFKYVVIVLKKASSNADSTEDHIAIGEITFYGHRENDLVRLPDPTNVLKYPHIDFPIGPNSNDPIGIRGYVASGSSSSSSGIGRRPWSAFNDLGEGKANLGGLWQNAEDGSNHKYTPQTTGLATTNAALFEGVYGEWIKLELPHKLKVSQVYILTAGAHEGVEKAILYGSNDDINWDVIKNSGTAGVGFTFTLTANGGLKEATESVTTSKYYKYLLLQVTEVVVGSGSSDGRSLQLYKLQYYGTEEATSVPIQIGGGNIDKVANFRVYDKFIGEDQALEIWDAQKEEFGRAKPQMVLQQGKLGIGTDAPQGSLSVADEPDPTTYGLQEFPPRAMTAYKNYFEGHGVFCASASSYYDPSLYQPYMAFDRSFNSTLSMNQQTYNSAQTYTSGTGVYPTTGTSKLGSFRGEWLLLELPYKIKLAKFSLSIVDDWAANAPNDFVVVGYDEDTTEWVELASYVTEVWPAPETGTIERIKNKSINSTSYHKKYAIVTSKITSSTNLNIAEWRLFGYREQVIKQSVLHDGQLTLTKNLTVPSIGPSVTDTRHTVPKRHNLVVEFDTSTNPTDLTKVRDTSGMGNDAVLYGHAYYSTADKAFKFDGTSDTVYVDRNGTPTDTNLPTGDAIYTISCWIKHTGTPTSGINPAVFFFGSGWTSNQLAGLFLRDGNKLGHDIGSTHVATTNVVINRNQWHHVVVVKRGTGTIAATTAYQGIFVDGVEITQLTRHGSDRTQALGSIDNISIGSDFNGAPGSFGTGFNGCVSKPQIWSVALTVGDVKTLYDMGRGDSYHVTNFQNTLVGINLGNGQAPRSALDVRDKIYAESSTVQTFTGQHICFPDESMEKGLIVSAKKNKFVKLNGLATGKSAITIDESLPIVSLSNVSQDKACFGVVSKMEESNAAYRTEITGGLVSESIKIVGDNRAIVNSVGEGAIWVVDTNGPLESGDYITTSNVAGYGQKQDSEFLANYSVAKITMDCDFTGSNVTVQTIKREETGTRIITEDAWNQLVEYDRYSNVEDEITTYYQIQRGENVLDDNGQLQFEDKTGATEAPYERRFLTTDGTQTDEANAVHIAAFVGCTYHCG